MEKRILFLTIVSVLVLLWQGVVAKADEIDDLKQQVAELQKKVAHRELAELKEQIAELNNRIIQLEEKQKLTEKSVEGQIEELKKEKPEASSTDLKAFWKQGLHFATQDGNFKLKVGGRLHSDW